MNLLVASYISIMIGTLIAIIGAFNVKKRNNKGEKTAYGKVVEFERINGGYIFPIKYKAIVKSGHKKYEIESYSMPWLKKDEEVKIQITGKQKILGTKRNTTKALVEFFIAGIFAVVIPIVLIMIYFA